MKALLAAGCHLAITVICLIRKPEASSLSGFRKCISNPGEFQNTELDKQSQVTLY